MKKKRKFKDQRLSVKLAVAIGSMLIITLVLLISISISLAKKAVTMSINGEFSGIAAQNGVMVQAIIDDAAGTARDLQGYLEYQYGLIDHTGYDNELKKSSIYNVHLKGTNADIEQYILSTAWATVENSVYVSGVGVFFERGTFDPSIRDYTIYVNEENAKNKTAQSYGIYEDYASEVFYQEASTTQADVFTEPYVDQGMTMVTASFPIIYDGVTQGVIVVDINVDNFSQLKTTDEKYPTMFVDVYNENGMMIYDSESKEYVGKTLVDTIGEKEYERVAAETNKGQSFHIKTLKDDGSNLVRYFYPITAGSKTWWAASALEEADLNKSVNNLMLIMIVMSVAALILIILTLIYLLRKFLRPLNPVVQAAVKLAEGNFNIKIKADSEDEIGILTNQFSIMANNLNKIIADLSRGIQEMSKGNFDIYPTVEYVGEFKTIQQAMADFLGQISRTLQEINESANQVSGGAEQISAGAQSLTEGATDQASSIEELQATVTEVSAAIERNARQAEEASKMTRIVGEEINNCNDQMQEMVKAMEEITNASNEINHIINTINDIADQTNLLALNASIEAARAGESGRGFAVVATEVGSLAAQCGEAAKNSTQLIKNAINAVENGKALADTTAERLENSQIKTVELVGYIGKISEASERQAEDLEQVTKTVEQIASVVEENTAMAEESSASSEDLADQSQLLKNLVRQFTLNKGV